MCHVGVGTSGKTSSNAAVPKAWPDADSEARRDDPLGGPGAARIHVRDGLDRSRRWPRRIAARTHADQAVLAALGCAALQLCAIVFHFSRGEGANTPFNFLLVALSLFVFWGRRKAPVLSRAG